MIKAMEPVNQLRLGRAARCRQEMQTFDCNFLRWRFWMCGRMLRFQPQVWTSFSVHSHCAHLEYLICILKHSFHLYGLFGHVRTTTVKPYSSDNVGQSTWKSTAIQHVGSRWGNLSNWQKMRKNWIWLSQDERDKQRSNLALRWYEMPPKYIKLLAKSSD